MIAISNSSPLIALSRIQSLNILKELFGSIFIPDAVYEETVLEANNIIQKENILKATNDFIEVVSSKTHQIFTRNLGKGEIGVLNLALEKNPDIILIDDKKARNEANSLGFQTIFTTDIIKRADKLNLISSYENLMRQLQEIKIYLPE
jgi:uncharacterized protein